MAWISGDNKGQVQTIEAFIATFILLTVLAVVVQATSVTPLTTSFTNQHIKYELQNMGQDILTSMDQIPWAYPASDTTPSRLEKSVRDWLVGDSGVTPAGDWSTLENVDANGVGHFKSAENGYEYTAHTELEKALTFAFSNSGIAYNVEVRYWDPTQNGVYSRKMIWNGDPSDNCVTVSRYITLHDDNIVPNDPAFLINGVSYVIPDISPGTSLHNVVEVRLTLWVM